jgi:hypothetical protein
MKNKILLSSKLLAFLSPKEISSIKLQLVTVALLVLFFALAGAFYFSFRKAHQKGQKIWTPVSKRLLLNLCIPLMAGAFFILILYSAQEWLLIVPAMLIFYGLALISAGKFTYNEVFYLGLAELLTGFISGMFQDFSVLFWIFGFGFLHIAYGLFMYKKYEG